VCLATGGGADGDGAEVAGRHTVDFEGLSFAQGGHLNTNKNTNLPPGSTRTTDKVPTGLTTVAGSSLQDHQVDSCKLTL